MKTSELTGAALDWAVAKCEPDDTVRIYFDEDTGEKLCHDDWDVPEFSPSTDWSQGGPIIERERIEVRYRVGVNMTATIDGKSEQTAGYRESHKPMLLAAMRCYVASKLGDEVELPKEITE